MAAGDTRKPIATPGRIATGKRYQPESSLVAVLERVKVVKMMAVNPPREGGKGARITPKVGKVRHMSWQRAKMRTGIGDSAAGPATTRLGVSTRKLASDFMKVATKSKEMFENS